jgi:hypothetical protein
LAVPGACVPCRGSFPGWVPRCVPVLCCCWVPLGSLLAVAGGGGVVVVDVDVALTGKTCLVEVFALVLTSEFGGIAALPELIAAAFVFSDVES